MARQPWDRRLAEQLARDSWEAANGVSAPSRRRAPPFREIKRSPYYWVSVLAWVGAIVIVTLDWKPGWQRGLVWALYLVGLVAGWAARRAAFAAIDRRNGTTRSS
jgi:hypothetical protein